MHEPTDGKTTKPFLAIDKDMMDRDDLTIYEKVVHAVIRDAIGKNKRCWTGAVEIARRSRFGRRTVQRSINILESRGDIVVHRSGRASGIPNQYSLPKKRHAGATSSAPQAHPSQEVAPGGRVWTRQRGAYGSATLALKLDPSTNPSTNPEDPPTPRGGKVARKKARDLSEEAESAKTTDTLRTPAFRECWTQWVQYRREKKSALTPSTVKAQIRKLEGFGHDAAIASIEASIGNGWAGLFARDGGRAAQPAKDEDPDAKFRALRK